MEDQVHLIADLINEFELSVQKIVKIVRWAMTAANIPKIHGAYLTRMVGPST